MPLKFSSKSYMEEVVEPAAHLLPLTEDVMSYILCIRCCASTSGSAWLAISREIVTRHLYVSSSGDQHIAVNCDYFDGFFLTSHGFGI